MHREVMVKVNVSVDEGIADLVAALSAIENLQTLQSCQGQPDEFDGFVYFTLGDWTDAGRFLFEKLLPSMDENLRANVSLSVRAYDTDHAVAQISVNPKSINALAKCVRTILSTVSPSVLVTRDAHCETVA